MIALTTLPRVAVSIILALAAVSGCADAEHPDEAARRLDILEALPIDEIRPPNAVLVREGTEPGAPGDGFLEDNVEISVSRSYRFDGDAGSACRGVEEQLRDQGWEIRTPCRSDSQGFDQIIVGFGVACQGFPVTGRFSFNERLPDLPDEENSYLWVSVPYPGTGATRLPPEPEGDGLSMCDDDEPRR